MYSPYIRATLCVAVIALSVEAVAQRPARRNGDCTGAIDIQDSVYVASGAARGFGEVLDVGATLPQRSGWIEREHHAVWYRFRVPRDVQLTFTITPTDPKDDIDFMLFRGAVPDLCAKIRARTVEPLRMNAAALSGSTGLARDGKGTHAVNGNGFGPALPVKAGELFYLLVDQRDPPRAGHTIHFNFGKPDPAPEPAPPQVLAVRLLSARDSSVVPGEVLVDGLWDPARPVGSLHHVPVERWRPVAVGGVAQGYLFRSAHLPSEGADTLRVDLYMDPIVEDGTMLLDDIRFIGNEADLRRTSEAALRLLLRTMQLNPQLHVRVEGHVNGPTYKNSKEFIRLSEGRARKVHDFLIVNDVEPVRVAYVGYGNGRMLYPDPKNRHQSEANRRVELRVMKP